MARTREIKPAFFLDEDLAELSRDARLLFIGLWTLVDRDGIGEDRPARIRAQVFPYDADITTEVVDHLLDELENWPAGKSRNRPGKAGTDPDWPGLAGTGRDGFRGFIQRYEINGKRYFIVRSFKKHQHIHPKEKPMGFPLPTSEPGKAGTGREKPGKAGTNPALPSEPSEPSLPSEPSGSSPARVRAIPPAPEQLGLVPTEPDETDEEKPERPAVTPKWFVDALQQTVMLKRPELQAWAPDQWARGDAKRFLEFLPKTPDVKEIILRRIAKFVENDRHRPWSMKMLCDRWNEIEAPARDDATKGGTVGWHPGSDPEAFEKIPIGVVPWK